MRLRASLVLAAIVVSASAAQAPGPQLVLKGLDPVDLAAGQETPGLEGHTVIRGRHEYRFAGAETKRRFETAPERFAVQMGGACARMGPLSGLGRPDIWYVHEGRIYLFAHDLCRTAFRQAPERYLDRPDPRPTGSEAEERRGRELVELALRGMGGAARVDALRRYSQRWKVVYQQGDQRTEGSRVVTAVFGDGPLPAEYSTVETWGAESYGDLLTPEGAYRLSGARREPHEAAGREALERQWARDPLLALRARRAPGFVASAGGRGRVEEREVEFLRVGLPGAATTFALNPGTGRIVQAAYRDRTFGYVGEVVKRYSDFREKGGLTLPQVVTRIYDGKPVTAPAITLEEIRVNDVAAG
jgi:YHS domain-containing protein